MERMNSITRMTMLSKWPPKYPAAPPIAAPSRNEMITPTNATLNEARQAWMVRENRSSPVKSVPNRWMNPSRVPNRWMSIGINPNIL